jgi:subtilisin family serine protease
LKTLGARKIRVIVGLRLKMRSDPAMSDAETAQQTQQLQSVQNALASRILGKAPDGDVVHFDSIPYMSMWVDAAQLRKLLADPQVVNLTEDRAWPALDAQSIPLMHAGAVWAAGYTGKGYTVAILDTGVAKNHPALAGRVVSEACYSSSNPPTITSFCPAGSTSAVGPGTGANCDVSLAGCDHGTHVASIAAGTQTNDIGVSPSSQIISIQVFSKIKSSSDCGGAPTCIKTYDSDWIAGLQRVYALRNTYKIAAVNLSFGGGFYSAACDGVNDAAALAINQLRNANIAITAASGDDGANNDIAYPACMSNAIPVASSTKGPGEQISSFSDYNYQVQFVAPGSNINAAVPPSGYAVKSGTSMAAPAAAGAISLLSAVNKSATLSDVVGALACTGKTVVNSNRIGQAVILGKPRFDFLAAYDHLILPKQIPWVANFSTAAGANDWTPATGHWSISGGAYVLTPKAPLFVGVSHDDCNVSETITATLSRVDSGTNIAGQKYYSRTGIMFKTQVSYGSPSVSGYFLAYDNAPAAILFKVGGMILNNDPLQVEETLCQASPFNNININGTNTLKIVSNNGTHTAYVNGTELCTVTDTTYTTGPVMPVAWISSKTGNSLSINQMSVAPQDSKPFVVSKTIEASSGLKAPPQAAGLGGVVPAKLASSPAP